MASEKTLYKRIGGYDVLAAVVDEFLRKDRFDGSWNSG